MIINSSKHWLTTNFLALVYMFILFLICSIFVITIGIALLQYKLYTSLPAASNIFLEISVCVLHCSKKKN